MRTVPLQEAQTTPELAYSFTANYLAADRVPALYYLSIRSAS